jgi:hypothetical protein
MGIDLLKRFNANLNYNTDVMTLDTGEEPLKLQLYTYQEAKIICDNEDDEEELSEEDEQAALINFIQDVNISTPTSNDRIKSLLNEYKDLFAEHFSEIPGIKYSPCTIKLKENSSPVVSRMPRYSPAQREVIKIEIDKMLKGGVIEPSCAPWISPIVLAPKPDGSIRFCINYKKLNKLTIKDKFPLPRIDDCLDYLSGKKYFSTLDCFSGYWQCKLDEASKPYTSFISPFGTFQFTVMPFGLTNAPAHFSRMMQSIFADQIYEILIIYLDDLCIASKNEEEHLHAIRKVFERLRKFGIKLKLKKCSFLCKEFIYLGFLVKDGFIAPNPDKVRYLQFKETPKNSKEVRSLLGLTGYFRQFIPNYTTLVKPIQALVKSNYFQWSSECTEVLNTLKKHLTNEPLLKLPDFNLPFVISCDASGYGIGSVLEQANHPVSYYSRKLHSHELNYTNYEKEALSVVSAVQQFHKYMLHAKTIIYTDNSAVASIFNAKDPKGRILRWINYLSSFDIEILHRNGKSNQAADYLSRNPINLVKNYSTDEKLHRIHDQLLSKQNVFKDFLLIDNELFYRKGSAPLKVLMTEQDLQTLLNFLHDQLGHASLHPIYAWISSRFHRPKLYSSIQSYIDSCHTCQVNTSRQPKYSFSGSLGVSGLFLAWSIDFLGPLPISSTGYSYIFIAVEHLSRYPIAIPCKDATGATAAQIVLTSIICNFGTPTSLYLDEGTCFTSHYFRDFLHKWTIDPNFAPPGSHELNGIAERMCRTVRLKLTRAVNSHWSHWDTHLPTVVLGIRSQITTSTGHTPFSILYGFEPRLPVDTSMVPRNLNIALRLIENSALPSNRIPLCKPTISSDSPTYSLQSLVLVQRNRTKHKNKTKTSYMGPFRIIDQFPHNRYSMVAANGKVKTFHASRLIPYHPRNDAFFEGGSVG